MIRISRKPTSFGRNYTVAAKASSRACMLKLFLVQGWG